MNNSPHSWIGRRVAHLRDLRGMSQTQLAQAIGVTQQYVSAIENGRSPVSRRGLLYALADALGVPNTELTGVPLPTSTREDLISVSAVAGIRAGLDYPDEPVTPRPRAELTSLSRMLLADRMNCDYAAVGAGLPGLLAETRAAWEEQGQTWAGYLLVQAAVTGSQTLRPIGWLDLAMRLAELGRRVAAQLGDPTAVGYAEYAAAQCVMSEGCRRASLTIASRAAESMPTTEQGPRSARGMLHLQAALSAASLGDDDQAEEHFADAERLAATMTTDPWGFEFHAANVATWRVGAALENGHPEQAPILAARVDRSRLRTPNRQGRLLLDAGRGHYMAGQTTAAVRTLLRAHEAAPTEIRTRPSVIEIVGQMLRDASGGPSSELAALATVMGIAA